MTDAWLPYPAVNAMRPMSRYTFNRMCRDNVWKCKKVGRTWYVHRSEFE